MTKTYPVGVFIIFPAVVMSLGWAMRGTIGGGQMGALIPGAMVALSLAILLQRKTTAAFLVLCGAVGIALGGQMTYGLTLGIIRHDERFWEGFIACFTKGAAWGISGSAIIGLALIRDRLSKSLITKMVLVMAAGTVIGWLIINKTRLIDLSYIPDAKPRNEIWAGLIFGAISLLAYHYKKTKDSFLIRFSLIGMVSGGIGFGIGALFLYYGPMFGNSLLGIGWWKCMEFFFGFVYGAGLGLACYLHRIELMIEQGADKEDQSFDVPWFVNYPMGMGLVFLVCYANFHIPFLPIFSVLCAVLVMIGMNSNYLSWQLGVTLTCMAFIRDSWNYIYLKNGMFIEEYVDMGKECLNLPEYQHYEKYGWSVIVILTLLIGFKVSRNYYSKANTVESNSILLIWTGVVFLIIKMFYHHPEFVYSNMWKILTVIVGAVLSCLISNYEPKDHIIVAARLKCLIWGGTLFLCFKLFRNEPSVANSLPLIILSVGMGAASHYMTKKYASIE